MTELAENMNGLTVQQAREWFAASGAGKPSAAANKRAKHKPYVFTPDWSKATASEDKNYYVVNASATFESRPGFLLKGYGTTVNGLSKGLVLKDRRTGEIFAALMHAYSADGKAPRDFGYRNVPQDFTGLLFYTNLSGEFVNGYYYAQGKISKVARKGSAGSVSPSQARSGCFSVPLEQNSGWVCVGDNCYHKYTNITYVNLCDYTEETVPHNANDGGYGGTGSSGGDGDTEPKPQPSYNVIKDSTITQSPKIDCIYEALIQGNSSFNNMLTAFKANNQINLTFRLGATSGEGTTLRTGNNYYITLNKNIGEIQHALWTTATFFHEAFHAQLREHAVSVLGTDVVSS
ncbi:hypothetical protein [Rufibacter sp. XAAS-G3-1]|uniref:hypothetical protein n=1 Tax=Rufibacter sp. XAAS-G3-1 TaxID=2729134 RepID=UPI0015E7D6A6|nr:hypothetical protein [Rufibacter sp. XAAS-G3-1]